MHVKSNSFLSGAPFHVKTAKSPASSPDSDMNQILTGEIPKLYLCKLTPDHRFLMFHEHDEDESIELVSEIDPLEVAKILDMQPIFDDKNQSVSICLRAKLGSNEEMSLRLDSPPEPSRKPSVQWLSALRRVCYM